MWLRIRSLAVLGIAFLASAPAIAQQLVALHSQPTELADYGVPPTNILRNGNYHAPTPTAVPGAVTVSTSQLAAMLARSPLLIDVRTDRTSELRTIAGALWWPFAGLGDEQYGSRFSAALAQATSGNLDREVVFMCLSTECWLSYNAALRAVQLGYRQVRWYRGGWHAWSAAGGPSHQAVRTM